MKYLTLRNGWYVYNRRVPDTLKIYDNRKRIRIALNTKCPDTAMKKRTVINDEIEGYWKSLIQTKSTHSKDKFSELVRKARILGFSYIPSSKLVEIPWEDLLSRVFAVKQNIESESLIHTVLGSPNIETITLSEALKRYWDYARPQLLNKNENQKRKWKNPRKKAVKNFIKHVGDMDISKITNLHIITLRDWWFERIVDEDISPSSANKDFIHLKSVLKAVSTHEQLSLDIDGIFKDVHFNSDHKNSRAVYTSEFIINELLNEENLVSLDNELKNILFVAIETGMRPVEILNLAPEDIILDNNIPHVHIRPRKGYSLKTKSSERKMPLVGCALEAFKNYPNGFNKFQKKPDQFSYHINRFLSLNGLRPTPQHTFYSLRHSFQDRLTALEVPDRIQCQLMGHSFKSKGRMIYGSGATLEHLQKTMEKIKVS